MHNRKENLVADSSLLIGENIKLTGLKQIKKFRQSVYLKP